MKLSTPLIKKHIENLGFTNSKRISKKKDDIDILPIAKARGVCQ